MVQLFLPGINRPSDVMNLYSVPEGNAPARGAGCSAGPSLFILTCVPIDVKIIELFMVRAPVAQADRAGVS